MPRIRSVHPGLFTDGDFAGLSDAAQVFYIGILTQCDDQGVFEWKPLELRIRLRPGKDGDVGLLLDELVAADRIKQFEANGRKFGAVRNFLKYQRPQRPNKVYPCPEFMESYLAGRGAIPESGAELEGAFHESTPENEGSITESDNRGNRRVIGIGKGIGIGEKEGSSSGDTASRLKELERKLRLAAGWQKEASPGLMIVGPIDELIEKGGCDIDLDVLPVIAAKAQFARRRTTWKYFVEAIKEAKADRLAVGKKSDKHAQADRDATARQTAAIERLNKHRKETAA